MCQNALLYGAKTAKWIIDWMLLDWKTASIVRHGIHAFNVSNVVPTYEVDEGID